MKILKFICLFVSCIGFSQSNYYVSLDGDNSWNGSEAQPFRSILKASQVALPGDNIYVKQGVYRNPDFEDGDIWAGLSAARIECNGSENKYITFQPASNEEVIFEFDGNYGLQISNSSYVIVKGFKIKGIREKIRQTDAQANWGFFKLSNGAIYDISNRDLDPNDPNKLPLPAGTIKPSYYNGRGLVANSSHHIIIENNIVYDCPSSAIRVEQSDYTAVRNNIIYQNTYWTTQGVGAITMAESTNVDDNDDYKIIIEKNLIYNNENRMISWNPSKTFITSHIDEGAGIFMTRNADTYLHGAYKIVNNIVYNSGTGGVICHFTKNALIANNTLYYNGTTGYGESGGIGVNTTENVTIANNIVYARPAKWALGTLSASNPNLIVVNNLLFNEGGVEISNVINTGFTVANPQFTNTADFDFRLANNSTAIDKGNVTYAPTTDYYGNTRNLPDIGALEYMATFATQSFESKINLKIHPNPFFNELSVDFNDNVEKVNYEIFNIVGQSIKTGNFIKNITINTSNFSSGTYFIKFNNGKTSEVRKLIKK
jgi:parallel beta-helix repeat protein